jgi:hypothetical protein
MPHKISFQLVLVLILTALVTTIVAEVVKLIFEWLKDRHG